MMSLRTWSILAREAFADSLRRRTTLAVALMAGFTLFSVDRCTQTLEGSFEWQGNNVDMAALAPAMGILLFDTLAFWLLVLAAVLAADALARPLEDGEAPLWLSRPVSRMGYALSRLVGAVGLAWTAGAALLGTTAALMSRRIDVALGPALDASLACAVGALAAGALAMTLSLWLPRIATVLLMMVLVWISVVGDVGVITGADGIRGLFGGAAHYGPGTLVVVTHALGAWAPSVPLYGDPGNAMLRLVLWALGSCGLLVAAFRRVEIKA